MCEKIQSLYIKTKCICCNNELIIKENNDYIHYWCDNNECTSNKIGVQYACIPIVNELTKINDLNNNYLRTLSKWIEPPNIPDVSLYFGDFDISDEIEICTESGQNFLGNYHWQFENDESNKNDIEYFNVMTLHGMLPYNSIEYLFGKIIKWRYL